MSIVCFLALCILVAAGVGLLIAGPASGEDVIREKCGAGANGNQMDASFRISHGRSSGGTFHLLVRLLSWRLTTGRCRSSFFNGPYLGPTMTHQVRNNVVCVVNADGDRTMYFDIPCQGHAAPG